jgi:hypothetical protein
MEDKINKLLISNARIEEKLDTFKEEQDRHRDQISTLNKRWYTSLGAFTIAIGSLIKSLLTH